MGRVARADAIVAGAVNVSVTVTTAATITTCVTIGCWHSCAPRPCSSDSNEVVVAEPELAQNDGQRRQRVFIARHQPQPTATLSNGGTSVMDGGLRTHKNRTDKLLRSISTLSRRLSVGQ